MAMVEGAVAAEILQAYFSLHPFAALMKLLMALRLRNRKAKLHATCVVIAGVSAGRDLGAAAPTPQRAKQADLHRLNVQPLALAMASSAAMVMLLHLQWPTK